jgi:hypothetical protein
VTVAEQRAAYAQLEPFWSGSRERAGLAPGLSAYQGRSSVYHSASWAQVEALEWGECKEKRGKDGERTRGPDRGARSPRIQSGELDAKIEPLLRAGKSYNAISIELGCSVTPIRRVAKRIGRDRAVFRGSNQWGPG